VIWLKNLVVRALNFLFGKTGIFITILGWFLVVTGILFLSRPEWARNKLLSHGFGIFKSYLKLCTAYAALLLISAALNTKNTILAVACALGVLGLFAGFFFLKKKAYEKLAMQFGRIPPGALKIFAWIQIAVGALMLLLQRRIW
jgi:uncharacterized protein YjeT (DUF2065 family)